MLILDNRQNSFTLSFYFKKHLISASSSVSLQFKPLKLSILYCPGFTAELYRIEVKLSKILNKMPRNRHSGIRNVQESTKLSRINPSYLEPFLDTSPRSNSVHLNTSNLFSTNTLTTELVIISTMDKTPTFISAFEAFLTQNPPQNDDPNNSQGKHMLQ